MSIGVYQHNYEQDLTGTGREICINDGIMSYYYHFAIGDTAEDAMESFASSYDYNLDPGDTGDNVIVHLAATEYLNGEVVDTRERDIRP